MAVLSNSLQYRPELWAIKIRKEDLYGAKNSDLHTNKNETLGLVTNFYPPDQQNIMLLRPSTRPSQFFPVVGSYFPFSNNVSVRNWIAAYDNSFNLQGSISDIIVTDANVFAYALGDKNVQTPFLNNIIESILLPSFSMEATYYQASGDSTQSLWLNYLGCKMDSVTIVCEEGQPLKYSINKMYAKSVKHNIVSIASDANQQTWLEYDSGLAAAQADNPIDHDYSQDIYLFSGGRLAIYEPTGNNQSVGPVDDITFGRISSFRLTINNNIQPQYYIQNLDSFGNPSVTELLEGKREYSCEIVFHPDDQDIYRFLKQRGYYGGERRGYGITLRFQRPLMANFSNDEFIDINMPASTQVTGRGWGATPFSYVSGSITGPVAGFESPNPVLGCFLVEAPHNRNIGDSVINVPARFEVPSVELNVQKHVVTYTPVLVTPPPTGIPIWVIYGPPTGLALRRMLLNSNDGTFMGWDTAEITGFGSSSGAFLVSAIRAHPTNKNIVYIAIENSVTGGGPRLYFYNGTTLTLVATVADPSVNIIDIYVEKTNANKVWFTTGANASPGNPPGNGFKGVWRATDGVTFTLVGPGHAGAFNNIDSDSKVLGITVQETVPRTIYATHTQTGAATNIISSTSTDEGVTWVASISGYGGTMGCGYMQPRPVVTPTNIFYNFVNSEVGAENIILGVVPAIVKQIGFHTWGGVFMDGTTVIRPSTDSGSPGNAGRAVGGITSANYVNMGNNWWDSTASNMPSAMSGFSFYRTLDWMAAFQAADSYFRLTLDHGTSWQSSTALPSLLRGVAFVEDF